MGYGYCRVAEKDEEDRKTWPPAATPHKVKKIELTSKRRPFPFWFWVCHHLEAELIGKVIKRNP